MNNKFLIVAIVCAVLIFSACSSADQNFPGSEYMPDMGHSIAYEANYYDYYYYNTWGTDKEYYKSAQPRKPVAGTIARGYAGVVAKSPHDMEAAMAKLTGQSSPNSISIPVNGSVPYYYADTEEERTRATAEIISNPYPITDAGLEKGKELYDIYCGICHGKKGDGNGYLVAEENLNAVYPAQPAILTNDEFTAASNGRFYHAIMHGKNVMGGYADKISYEERWQVIHYIRSLQMKDRKLVYGEEGNSLNNVDIPAFRLPKKPVAVANHDAEHAHDEEHHDANHEGEDHGHDNGGHEGGNHDSDAHGHDDHSGH